MSASLPLQRAPGATRPGLASVSRERACPHSCWSAPSGATRARARPPTSSAAASTSWSSSTAATTPATPSSSATTPTRCTCCRAASSAPAARPVIGNGVVVDLVRAVRGDRRARGARRLLREAGAVGRRAPHPPYNRTLDRVAERFLGKKKIGTTGRGIGPTYADKMNRIGIRVQDLFDEGILRQKVEGALVTKNQVLTKVYNRKAVAVDEVVAELLAYVDRVRPMVADTSLLLNQALDRGETVLLEGGQATLLDVDHGTYPFVTSSSATAGGACTGSGIGPRRVDKVIAVVKAYTTRVGEGPFPTELLDADGERLRSVGHEYGTTTGPPAPLRLVRRRHRPLRRPRQRRHRLRPHQARRAHRLGEDPGLRRLRGRRPAPGRDADEPDRLPPRDAGLRAARRLDRGHLRRAHLRGPPEERAAVRAGARADERRPVQQHRRRAGPRADAPAPLPAAPGSR